MESNLETMSANVARIREKMAEAAIRSGRRPEDVFLCAACKTRTVDEVKLSASLDIDLFGENHVQELRVKYDAGAYLGKPVHLIGHLQTNKLKYVLGRASLIESVDSAHILEAIEKEASKRRMIQDVCIEVNIGNEENKTGLPVDQLGSLLDLASLQRHVRVRGLMTVPPVSDDINISRGYFSKTRELYEDAKGLRYSNISMDVLSMGMSGDYEAAILEGATIVRIGTAIYGPRDYGNKM